MEWFSCTSWCPLGRRGQERVTEVQPTVPTGPEKATEIIEGHKNLSHCVKLETEACSTRLMVSKPTVQNWCCSLKSHTPLHACIWTVRPMERMSGTRWRNGECQEIKQVPWRRRVGNGRPQEFKQLLHLGGCLVPTENKRHRSHHMTTKAAVLRCLSRWLLNSLENAPRHGAIWAWSQATSSWRYMGGPLGPGLHLNGYAKTSLNKWNTPAP